MAVKNYGIHDQWTNLDTLNNVDIKSVDGVIESVKINGEEAGSGGGSSVQTVTGTLANPWGDINPTDIKSVLRGNGGIAIMEMTAMGDTVTGVMGYQNGLYCNGGYISDPSNMSAISVWFSPVDNSFEFGNYYHNGTLTDISTYASNIATKLTVVYFPTNSGIE